MSFMKKILAQYSEASNDKDQDAGDLFYSSVEEFKKEVLKELKSWDRVVNEIASKLSTIEDLAKKGKEGDDYYGKDYLTQMLTSKEKEFMNFKNKTSDIFDFTVECYHLRDHLDTMIKDLKRG